ncbi:hypothetical protein Zmor_003783 [Zophobas morio]|uniref:Uncharacterized protein n=1 Tax=Zophobas morio TaxID=2755281 RepID=A0AA38HNB0_9CUCU|nr:hypothetical protein Zmor_003783 [Zophobas morio]
METEISNSINTKSTPTPTKPKPPPVIILHGQPNDHRAFQRLPSDNTKAGYVWRTGDPLLAIKIKRLATSPTHVTRTNSPVLSSEDLTSSGNWRSSRRNSKRKTFISCARL